MELKEKYTIDDLLEIMVRLRQPDGCPWDREQTHQTIKKSLIEETYEAIDALDFGTDRDFANELGDVLLQVVFHSELANERGAFDFSDVLYEVCTKLITRHPHVFGDVKADNSTEALASWEASKKKEKNIKTYTGILNDVPKYLPALMRAEKVQKKARSFGFDWDDIAEVYKKVDEEIVEVKEATESGVEEKIREEYGDLLFAVVNLGRFLNTDPETALTGATNKFISRYEKMENLAEERGLDMSKMGLEELDALWNCVK